MDTHRGIVIAVAIGGSAAIVLGAAPWASAGGRATGSVMHRTLLTGADTALGRFSAANGRIGPLHAVRRFYSGALPSRYSKLHVPRGVVAFVSYKKPSRRTAAFARSCPAGTRIIFHHEPENDYGGNGAAFVAQYERQYHVLKAANRRLRVGMAAMSYQYAGGRHGQSGRFLPPARRVDFYAVDNYEAKPSGRGLAADTAFQHWYRLVRHRGKPLLFAEYGVGVRPVHAKTDRWSHRRAATFRADRRWLIAHPAFTTVLYWYNTGARGDWRFRDRGSIAAWRAFRNL